ncbi:adhesin OmpL37 family surface protein [Leptospira ilyithenensis]|uniref:AraC family transcriptional regulator n=1 Tax=Leptospira ilyithenensis TaxID=2484901 RepID=A0A4R9LV09_9LEPT|nr:AraC family transcriptional regulator [Leptospira ilyithenensis]TGN16769.1 AraC family transcriptional regulator [Leptospira ilyithenensis]
MGKWKFILFVALASLHISHLSAVSPEQTNLGILIFENKENINFINICLSNLSPPQEDAVAPAAGTTTAAPDKKNLESNDYFKMLKAANQTDFSGNMWYLQSNYSYAFRQLRGAQGELKTIYEVTLQRYIEDARALLESAAPAIIRSNDNSSKALLRLGFRDLRSAEDLYTTGLNSSPHQYRYKLTLYKEGILTLRRAKRFAILSMIYSKTPDEDKPEYQYRSLDDIKDARNEEKQRNYEKVRDTLINFMENKRMERAIAPPGNPDAKPLDLLEQHDDNYGFITSKRLDLLQEANLQIKETEGAKRESVPAVPKFDEQGKATYEEKPKK